MARSRLQRKKKTYRKTVCPTGMKPNPDKDSKVNCVLDIKAAGGSSKYQPGSPYASKRPRIYGSPDEHMREGNAPVYQEVRGLTRSRLTESTAPGRNYSGDACSGNDDCGPIEICVNGECEPVGGSITAPTRHLQFSPMSRSKRRRKKFARYGR